MKACTGIPFRVQDGNSQYVAESVLFFGNVVESRPPVKMLKDGQN